MELKYKNHEDLTIKRKATVDRKTFIEHLTFDKNHGAMFTEYFGPLIGLKEEWEEQGATEAELDFSAFKYRCPADFSIPVTTGRLGQNDLKLLKKTEDHTIHLDNLGRHMKRANKTATIPLPMNFPVKTGDDWLKIKHLYEYSEERFQPGWEELSFKALDEGKVIRISIPGGFDEPRQLFGEEELSYAWYDEPELIHDILNTISETAWKVIDRVTKTIPVDMLFIHEDMAGKSDPLAGPVQIDEFLKPYYRSFWDKIQERGCRLFDQDSDGFMEPVMDNFLECGVNVMHPLEPAAGMDMVHLRKKYGKKMAFIGGLDKFAVIEGGERMEKELLYKVPFMKESGGCMLGLDHRVPNGTPLKNYKKYIKRMWELIE